MVTASPSLVGDNNISDCHRFCSLVLERSASTQCKFAFPDGNRLSLVVLDDEGRSLAWTCQYAHQFFRLTYTYTWYTHAYNIGHGVSTWVLCLLPAIVMSFFLPLHTISLSLFISTTLSTFPSSIDVFVSFSTSLAQVREDNGFLALTLRSTQAVAQPFTVHLNSRLLPPGDNTATGECTVCCRRRNEWTLAWMTQMYVRAYVDGCEWVFTVYTYWCHSLVPSLLP